MSRLTPSDRRRLRQLVHRGHLLPGIAIDAVPKLLDLIDWMERSDADPFFGPTATRQKLAGAAELLELAAPIVAVHDPKLAEQIRAFFIPIG